MKVGVLAITVGGRQLAGRLAAALENACLVPTRNGVQSALAESWKRFDGLVCIMAAGIVVRAIAPLLRDKHTDPGVVVVDELGNHAISLLSGHLGGGNALARKVAEVTGGRAVITTASEVLGLAPLDLWLRSLDLAIENRQSLTRASARLVNHGCLHLYAEIGIVSLPAGLIAVPTPAEAEVVISERTGWKDDLLVLRPKTLVVGVGCNRGVSRAELAGALEEFLAEAAFSRLAVRNLATIDLKRGEAGLLEFAGENRWPLTFYSKDQLNTVAGLTRSAAVYRATGAQGVAEPAARLSAGTDNLLIGKKKWKNVTLALARADCTWSAPVRADSPI
jgi:cobalt-precorrin 5A hydrolase